MGHNRGAQCFINGVFSEKMVGSIGKLSERPIANLASEDSLNSTWAASSSRWLPGFQCSQHPVFHTSHQVFENNFGTAINQRCQPGLCSPRPESAELARLQVPEVDCTIQAQACNGACHLCFFWPPKFSLANLTQKKAQAWISAHCSQFLSTLHFYQQLKTIHVQFQNIPCSQVTLFSHGGFICRFRSFREEHCTDIQHMNCFRSLFEQVCSEKDQKQLLTTFWPHLMTFQWKGLDVPFETLSLNFAMQIHRITVQKFVEADLPQGTSHEDTRHWQSHCVTIHLVSMLIWTLWAVWRIQPKGKISMQLSTDCSLSSVNWTCPTRWFSLRLPFRPCWLIFFMERISVPSLIKTMHLLVWHPLCLTCIIHVPDSKHRLIQCSHSSSRWLLVTPHTCASHVATLITCDDFISDSVSCFFSTAWDSFLHSCRHLTCHDQLRFTWLIWMTSHSIMVCHLPSVSSVPSTTPLESWSHHSVSPPVLPRDSCLNPKKLRPSTNWLSTNWVLRRKSWWLGKPALRTWVSTTPIDHAIASVSLTFCHWKNVTSRFKCFLCQRCAASAQQSGWPLWSCSCREAPLLSQPRKWFRPSKSVLSTMMKKTTLVTSRHAKNVFLHTVFDHSVVFHFWIAKRGLCQCSNQQCLSFIVPKFGQLPAHDCDGAQIAHSCELRFWIAMCSFADACRAARVHAILVCRDFCANAALGWQRLTLSIALWHGLERWALAEIWERLARSPQQWNRLKNSDQPGFLHWLGWWIKNLKSASKICLHCKTHGDESAGDATSEDFLPGCTWVVVWQIRSCCLQPIQNQKQRMIMMPIDALIAFAPLDCFRIVSMLPPPSWTQSHSFLRNVCHSTLSKRSESQHGNPVVAELEGKFSEQCWQPTLCRDAWETDYWQKRKDCSTKVPVVFWASTKGSNEFKLTILAIAKLTLLEVGNA